jgi:TrmH family RNA methyltransferase
MPIGSVVLVEPAFPINLGAAFRLAANLGVPRVALVRPGLSPDNPEVRKWACGAFDHLTIEQHEDLADAITQQTSVVGTASARGRDNLPTLTPREVVNALARRGADSTAVVFGNETRGLGRSDLDRCDMVLTIPTEASFPVLNLTQAMAVVLGYLHVELGNVPPTAPEPACHAEVEQLTSHLQRALLQIGFLDPVNPHRIIRKLRRLLGRAGASANEVAILHGICRQMMWAAGQRDDGRWGAVPPDADPVEDDESGGSDDLS